MSESNTYSEVFGRLRDFAEGRHLESGPRSDANAADTANFASGDFEAREIGTVGFGTGMPHVEGGPLESATQSKQDEAPHGICELCSLPLAATHRHLYEVSSGEVVCACDGCALTFHGVADGPYKVVPRDARKVEGFTITDMQWDHLSLPINLAFFVRDVDEGGGGVRALYPSPAGVTESELPFDMWEAIFEENDMLDAIEPYVEAMLVNRLSEDSEVFVVPIDLCYELTGLIRIHWKGLSGGEEVQRQMTDFFDRVRAGARSMRI